MSASVPTPAERAAARRSRNRKIAEAREAGTAWAVIASQFGLSERHARRAYGEHLRDAGEVVDIDGATTLRDILSVHVWALRELREVASSADNDSARVGAIRSRVSVSHDLLRLLVMAGILPPAEQAFRLRLQQEQHRFVVAVLDALERRNILHEDLEEDLDRALRGETVVR